MRRKQLISYASLCDAKGDVSKNWYVAYSFRVPDDDQVHRYKVYNGLCSGTAEERYKTAAKLIRKINKYLKSGEYLQHNLNYSPVQSHESFRPEARRLMEIEASHRVGRLMPRYIKDLESRLRKKSWQTYKSKLDCFARYVESHIHNKPVTELERKDILPFFSYLSGEKGITSAGIRSYTAAVHRFFDWLEDIEIRAIDSNPVKKIPNYGRVVDQAPEPFTAQEACALKELIEKQDPYLWLMCELQYYCCFRPGTELRLLKVSDICVYDRTITIRAEYTKQKQTIRVQVPEIVFQDIERLKIPQYPKHYYVFTAYGQPAVKPIGYNTMRVRFNRFRDQLGISPTKSLYSWKHTGAIQAYENGANVSEIQDLLHHNWIGSTEHYIKKRIRRIDAGVKYVPVIGTQKR